MSSRTDVRVDRGIYVTCMLYLGVIRASVLDRNCTLIPGEVCDIDTYDCISVLGRVLRPRIGGQEMQCAALAECGAGPTCGALMYSESEIVPITFIFRRLYHADSMGFRLEVHTVQN